jgi:ribonuclease R
MAPAKPTSKIPGRNSGNNEGQLQNRLQKLLSNPAYEPMNKSELARSLGVTPKQRQALRHILNKLEETGKLRQVRKGRYILRGTTDSVGILHFNPAGHAFVDPEGNTRERGVFIPPGATGTGLHGDKVAVRIEQTSGTPHWAKHIKNKQVRGKLETKYSGSSKSSEGRVVKVLERRNDAVIATFLHRGRFSYAKSDDPLLPPTIELDDTTLPKPPPKPGEKVVVAIEHWESRRNHPRGRITEILGPPNTPGIDILQVICTRRLPRKFPQEVIAEAKAFSGQVTGEDIAGREDWRKRPVFTIDPDDARDFDDAILVEDRKDGGWDLAVHIADVSHYVKPGSKLDREAKIRGNSTYLADRVIPMLPETLSNGLCSLVPGEDRLTHAAIMRFDKNAGLTSLRFCKAVIRNARRFTYKQAYALMQKPDPDDAFCQHLQTAWQLAAKLRKERFNNGSLDLDMPEVRAVLDKAGVPVALERIENDESHQLIEEFMLATNEAVAKHTKDKLTPSIYRVHEDPDADKLFEFRQLALDYGINAGDLANRGEIQKLLTAARNRPEEHAIKVGLLKSLKRANYESEPIGHYGLAKVNYTHFTSPIRRYADLVVHRVLGAITGNAPEKTPPAGKLAELAGHLSDTERNSSDAEFETQKLKQIEFLWREAKQSGEKNPITHPAMIHEVRRKGLFVELTDIFIKGLVTEAALPPCKGGYWFDGAMARFIGSKPKRVFQAGDTVQVTVSRVDFQRRMVDFKIIE